MEDAFLIFAQQTPTDHRNMWLALAVTGVAVLWMTFRSIRTRRDPLANKPFRMNLAQQKSLERDMQNLLVELSSMTRQLNAQLETRAAKIELLIADADKRIAELKRLEKVEGLKPEPSMIDSPSSSAIDMHVDFSRLGFDAPRNEVSTGSSVEPNIEPISALHAEVYQLADEGMDAQQIAQKLSRPRGEVELLLALYRPVKEDSEGVEIPKIAIG